MNFSCYSFMNDSKSTIFVMSDSNYDSETIQNKRSFEDANGRQLVFIFAKRKSQAI
jgi:hypothetical protein